MLQNSGVLADIAKISLLLHLKIELREHRRKVTLMKR